MLLHPALVVVLVGILSLLWSVLFARHQRRTLPPLLEAYAGKRVTLRLREKRVLSHDSFILGFDLPHAQQRLGLPVGQHLIVYGPNRSGSIPGEWNGKADAPLAEISRKFTPISSDENPGSVELLIKAYRPCAAFPDGGKLSAWLDTLSQGAQIQVSGPVGQTSYLGRGRLLYKDSELSPAKEHLVMLCGGSGITPMLQIINAIVNDPNDRTRCTLIFGNKSERDILCRDHLEEVAALHPDRLKLWFTVDRPESEKNWRFGRGYIDAAMVESVAGLGNERTAALVCGPPAMKAGLVERTLPQLGYKFIVAF